MSNFYPSGILYLTCVPTNAYNPVLSFKEICACTTIMHANL